MYKFEKLKVWQDGLVLVEMVYEVCKSLPSEERFALADQLRRSSTSVVLNIAEGCGSLGNVEFKSFLRNARKSLLETVAGIKIAERLFNKSYNKTLDQAELVGKELSGLIKSLKAND